MTQETLQRAHELQRTIDWVKKDIDILKFIDYTNDFTLYFNNQFGVTIPAEVSRTVIGIIIGYKRALLERMEHELNEL